LKEGTDEWQIIQHLLNQGFKITNITLNQNQMEVMISVPLSKNPEHESLEDSFKDMANYAIIGLLVLRDKWDK